MEIEKAECKAIHTNSNMPATGYVSWRIAMLLYLPFAVSARNDEQKLSKVFIPGRILYDRFPPAPGTVDQFGGESSEKVCSFSG